MYVCMYKYHSYLYPLLYVIAIIQVTNYGYFSSYHTYVCNYVYLHLHMDTSKVIMVSYHIITAADLHVCMYCMYIHKIIIHTYICMSTIDDPPFEIRSDQAYYMYVG